MAWNWKSVKYGPLWQAWLGAKKLLLFLPTISSLRARFVKAEAAAKPFAGIADPILERSLWSSAPRKTTGSADAEISALAEGGFLSGLAPLPETAVFVLAQPSGVGKGDVTFGEMATETGFNAPSLGQYRLVLFAAHGLVSGELSAVDEPGLVLTPPSVPTIADDGYLGLSEIMNLRFDADMIILSASNTAACDGRSGAPGFSVWRAAAFTWSTLLCSIFGTRPEDHLGAPLSRRFGNVDDEKLSYQSY